MDNQTSRLLYSAAGEPAQVGNSKGFCRVCGQQCTGMPFNKWVRDTFTDYDKLQSGDIVCHACQFVFAEASVELQQATGKDKPQKMRNYSHFVLNGQWYPLTKGQKQEMRAILAQSPEVAVIADSGQKHLLFRARPGWLQFEEQSIPLDWAALHAAIGVADELYRFFNKEQILTGRYPPPLIKACGIDAFLGLEAQASRLRNSVLWCVAVFLARKDETDNANRQIRNDNANCARVVSPDMARNTIGVQIELPI